MSGSPFRQLHVGSDWLMVDIEFEKAVLEFGPARLLESADESARAAVEGGFGRAPTRIVSLPGRSEQLHVRRALHGGLLARFWCGYLLGVGRARSELRSTALLRARGAPVPRPVLAIGRRSGIFWKVAVATVHEPNARDALALIEDILEGGPADRVDERRVCAVAAAGGDAIRRFHDLGGRHPDLHLKNILIREDRAHCEALVIDLDRGSVGAAPRRRRRLRELARLRRSLRKHNLLDRLGDRACRAFIDAYGAEALRSGNADR